jgi:ABC-type transport system substrate-binding protein
VTWFLVFNHRRPAFGGAGQIPLKKAVNYAIDRPELTRIFGYLAGRRTALLLPPAFDRGRASYPLGGADPATARKWLGRAKLPPERLVLYTSNDNRGVAIAQVLAYNFKQIGIELDVRYYDFGALIERAGRPGEPWDLMLSGWGADYADPAGFIVPLMEGQGNVGAFADARVSARIAAVNRLDGEARGRAWAQLDADLMRTNPPWAPFMNDTQRMVVSRSLGCFFPHPFYGIDIAAVCKK